MNTDTYQNLNINDTVAWDTFEGLRTGTVTAVGSYWVEVDGWLVPNHVILSKKEN